jgi:hypothetical protein
LAASSRELAFRLLHIRRPGAGIRRLFTPGRKVGGLFEKARGDIRIRRGHCKFEKGCRLFCQIFLARHNLVPRYYTRYYPPLPVRLRTAAESVPGKSTKVNLKRGGRGRSGVQPRMGRAACELSPRSLGPWPGRKALRLGQLKRRLCLPVLAEASTCQKEHIANMEQTWYEISVRRRILNLPPPVCSARESPP